MLLGYLSGVWRERKDSEFLRKEKSKIVIEEERAIKTPEEQERIAELSFKSVYSIGEMEGR